MIKIGIILSDKMTSVFRIEEDILKQKGYKLYGQYEHSYSSNESGVFIIGRNKQEFYAKNFKGGNAEYFYTWNEYKQLLIYLSSLNITPKIQEFIDLSENSGIVINESYGSTYAQIILQKSYYSDDYINKTKYNVISALKDLHERGYIHGDLHADNILLGCNGVKFIDLDSCYHKSDKRCLHNLFERYCTYNIQKVMKKELNNVDMII